MRNTVFILLFFSFYCFSTAFCQEEKYRAFFEEAYAKYPNIPLGYLESVAFNNTRFHHLTPSPNGYCTDMPVYYGVMGLIEDGKGFFKTNLKTVAKLSGYSVEEIKKSPRINILAYAKAYSLSLQESAARSRDIDGQKEVVDILSELPSDESVITEYARDQQFYGILKGVENYRRSLNTFDYVAIFGKEKTEVLTAKSVTLHVDRAIAENQGVYLAERSPEGCGTSGSITDYKGAIWNPAHPNNQSSRRDVPIDMVIIHTTEGSYAGSISWFKMANKYTVSAHYIIRSFDGQITQMVCEKRNAHHANDYNRRSIGVEHEGFTREGAAWYTDALYESSSQLVKDICMRHNINPLQMYSGKPLSGRLPLGDECWKIKGHQHLSGKNTHTDPGQFWDWERYFRMINGFMPEKRVVMTDSQGEIFDDGGKDGNYGNQQRIGYFIQPMGASTVTLEFKEMDLEAEGQKYYDYIVIYEGKNPDGVQKARYSGANIPPKMNIQGGNVYIEFVSDCQVNRKGFHIVYSSGNTNPSPTTNALSQLTASAINPFGATLAWNYNGQATKYRISVKNTLEELWNVYETPHKTISITGLSSGKKYVYRVQPYVGNTSGASESGSFETSDINPTKVFSTSLEKGRFFDTGGALSGYASKEDYTYKIQPPSGRVKLKITMLDTKEGRDLLKIYDGSSTNSTQLAALSGKLNNQEYTSTQNAITLHFTSGSRGPVEPAYKGWNIEWTTIGGPNLADAGTYLGTQGETGPINNGSSNNGGGSGGGSGGSNNSGNAGNTGGGTPPAPVGAFDVALSYPTDAPTSQPKPLAVYTENANLSFDDADKSGKGIAARFYCIAELAAKKEWTGNTTKGFFYDDFEVGLKLNWKREAGGWDSKNGIVRQTDATEDNANIHTAVQQDNSSAYLYNWQARMTGTTANKRCGFHFFADSPDKKNRGNSYFIWARDGEKEDKIEIYKTFISEGENKFELKASALVSFEKNKAYDYKVIYYPSNGKIVVYLNHKFVLTWDDPAPLTVGSAISLRSGGTLADFDNVKVFKMRNNAVIPVTVGEAENNDFRVFAPTPKTPSARILSLVIDKNGTWSKEGDAQTVVKKAGTTTGGTSSSGGGTTSGSGNNPPPAGTAVFSEDFSLPLTISSAVLQNFILIADNHGASYRGNESLGFCLDRFDEPQLYEKWKKGAGSWNIVGGQLQQSDEANWNGNISLPLTQKKGSNYMYSVRFKLSSKGENRRFGLHLFATDANTPNKGDSYLIWFRLNDAQPNSDFVEIHRSVNNELKTGVKQPFDLQAETWYHARVVVETATGIVTVWVNGQKVTSWKDTHPAIYTGNFISLRTGTASVWVDNLAVYQQASNPQLISIGNAPTKMIRHENKNGKPGGQIFFIDRDKSDKWINESMREVHVKFK